MCGILGLIAGACFAEETDPGAILKKVADKYKSMETFSAEGSIVIEVDDGTSKSSIEKPISMKLKKPNLYLVSWGSVNSGAVWSNGAQAFVYHGIVNSYSSEDVSLATHMIILSGGTATIPKLFLTELSKDDSPFDTLSVMGIKDIKLESSEKVDGDDCYVIGGNQIGQQMTFWISKKNFLILKERRVMIPEDLKMPEISDADCEKGLKATGQEVTKENVESMRKNMDNLRNKMKKQTMKTTEKYEDINTPALTEKDFNFEVPKGAVLKESMSGKATKKAKTTYCISNLKQIVMCVKMYAKEHDGNLPPKGVEGLEMLRSGGFLADPAAYVCSESKKKPAKKDEAITSATCDYVYCPPVKKIEDSKNPSMTPVAWHVHSRDAKGTPDCITVGFLDGEARELKDPAVEAKQLGLNIEMGN